MSTNNFLNICLNLSILINSKHFSDILKDDHYFFQFFGDIKLPQLCLKSRRRRWPQLFWKSAVCIPRLWTELLSVTTFKNVDLGCLPFLVPVKWTNQNIESLENKWILCWKFHIVPGLIHVDTQFARSRDASVLLPTLEKKNIARFKEESKLMETSA